MIEWIKNEIICIRMLLKLKKITADYYAVLSKLRRLRELADTLGEIGEDIQKDAEKAENQCKDCIHRFNNVNESLKDRDYRYIHHQMLFVAGQAKAFEESARKVNNDALNLMIHINKRFKGGNEHDLRRVGQESEAGS